MEFDGLATDCLERSLPAIMPTSHPKVEETSCQAMSAMNSVGLESSKSSGEQSGVVVDECAPLAEINFFAQETCTPEVDSVVVFCEDAVVVKRYRKVSTNKSHKYMNALVAECKLKFGVPVATTANCKAVRRYAESLMQSHGVRPTHARKYLPTIERLVFVPDRWQIEAAGLVAGKGAWRRFIEWSTTNMLGVAPQQEA